ncbi:MAG: DNA replication/repair protein RecF [Wenzhouxiangella sp.]|nr:DNA replication/repair protein RecF [Wenzhouxiangella sp.]MCH8476736.1 DNA replication/repair protein RecF [Wenzhouxiangella sp.]TVR92842.1 MAG: DNA replication/repair protein RecF [Wenzhouxiangellaceae bacterium]
MIIERLSIKDFRNLGAVDLSPSPGFNCLYGDNGAGKTSVLEAIHVLARGRSFRAGQIAPLVRHGSEALRVVVRGDDGNTLGVERSRDHWRGRVNGQVCQRLSEFASRLPLVLIEPDSHRLVDGGPERRRQYLDWLLFHVEQTYLSDWQRYARLLRQRNAALKSGAADAVLSALEKPMAEAALRIDSLRRQQVTRVAEAMAGLVTELSLRLSGDVRLDYRPGSPQELSLLQAWAQQRASDRERGFTQRGPHRADLRLNAGAHPAAQALSRGQQKLLAIVLLLAQLRILASSECAVLLLDDPVSELDRGHLASLLAWLPAQGFQSWVTATESLPGASAMFHVERGEVVRC